MDLLAPLLFALVLSVLLWRISSRRTVYPNRSNLPPAPPKLPIIGNLHQIGKLPHRSLQHLAQRHGPLILLQLGRVPTLVVSSAKLAEQIMKTNDCDFAGRPALAAPNKLLYGCKDMAFSSYGEYWKQVRKISVLELLSNKQVQSFGFVREEEVWKMMRTISNSCRGLVNMRDLLISLTNDVVCRVSLGKKYGSSFAHLGRETAGIMGSFFVGDFFPCMGWLDVFTGLDWKARKNFRAWDEFLNMVIREHLEPTGNYGTQTDFVDVLLRLQKHSTLDIPFTMDHIKALLLDMISGATETTATTLEWAMAELIKNPKVMMETQEEVRRVAGNKLKVEESDMYQMNYIKLTIMETLRLHPPAPILVPRESIRDVEMQGYIIPAKTRVYINAWVIGRDPTSWERAEEFHPERFINTSIDFKGQNFQFIPFGAGRRGCPGISFAITLMELPLANLLHQFDWELPNGLSGEDLDMEEQFGISVPRKHDLLLVPTPHFF